MLLQKRSRMVYNFTTARSIGIVAQVTCSETMGDLMGFKSFLESKNIGAKVLIFYPEKVIPSEFLMRMNVDVFSGKETNFIGLPTSPLADSFIASNFDILIDLSTTEIVPLRWITSISQAKFKVGVINYPGNPFDLIVSVNARSVFKAIIEDVKYILQTINNRG